MTNDQFGVAPAASGPAGLDHASLQKRARRSSAGVSGSLIQELSASPGRFVLIEARAGADEVIGEWEQMLDTTRCSVGGRLTYLPEPPSSNRIEALLRPDPLLVDTEILFAPELAVDPLALLRRLARSLQPEGCPVAGYADSRSRTVFRSST